MRTRDEWKFFTSRQHRYTSTVLHTKPAEFWRFLAVPGDFDPSFKTAKPVTALILENMGAVGLGKDQFIHLVED